MAVKTLVKSYPLIIEPSKIFLYFRLIKEKPTLLETFSYIFFYSSCLIGPSYEFSDFIKFIKLEGGYEDIDYSKCTYYTGVDLFWALVCIMNVITLANEFPLSYCGTEEFKKRSFLQNYTYMVLSMLAMRSRYYIGWKMMQASCKFCGLSYYKDKNGEVKCDLIDNCNIYNIEVNLSIKTRIQYWNRTVHLWLKYHVYMRLINLKIKPFYKNKAAASLITFMISAFWHGFYPLYYLFFFLYYLIEQIGTALEEKVNFIQWVNKQNVVIKFLWWLLVMSMVNYFGLCFTLVRISAMINFFIAFKWIPVIILFGAYFYCYYVLKPRKVVREEKSNDTKQSIKQE
jgi:lysophospholipid acyltransferase